MSTTTTTSSKPPTKVKQPKKTSIYIQILGFGFYLIQILTVLCSWRIFFLFTDTQKIENNKDNKDNKDKDENKQHQKQINLTFKEKVKHNFFCLFTDSLYLIMLIVTCTLFFWRCKDTILQLKNSDSSSKYKQIIWNQFTGGFVEFGSFTVLLLLKWPVIFKVFWNKGTDKEDKSTWSQIFVREFSQETNKNKPPGMPNPPQVKTTNFGGNGSSSTTTRTASNGGRAMSDDEWRQTFRRDLQNIGFEFDSTTGDVTKFPPTEVMEQYQKSSEFRELVLSAGSMKANSKPQDNDDNNNNNDTNDNNNGPKIEEYDDDQEQQQQQQTKVVEQEKEKEKEKPTTTNTTTTTTTTKKGKKGKKGRN